MDLLYVVAYIGALVFAGGWYFIKSRASVSSLPPKLFTAGFWLSVLTYAMTLLLDDGSIFFKIILLLPRDLMIFGLFVMFVNRFLKMPKTLLVGVLIIGGVFKFFWADFMRVSYNSDFDDVKNLIFAESVEVDENAELLFDIKNVSDLNAIQEGLSEYNPEIKLAFPDLQHPEYSNLEEYYTLNVSNYDNLDEVIQQLNALNMTDWVERNEAMKLDLPQEADIIEGQKPNLGVNDPDLDKVWGHKQMNVTELYSLIQSGKLKPTKKAKIAILDTGVDGAHEDLNQNYISTDTKYDSDKQGHGTHCAGIAAAVSNNAKGIASYSPNSDFVEVTSIKVLSDEGWGTQKDILEGMIKAADVGADVISMSLGGPSNDLVQKAYEEVVKYAEKSGAIIVVAAGNSNKNAKDFSPANVRGVISVSAVDEELNRAKFSNYITDLEMGIAAPGVNVYSTIPNNKYASFNGTSMATPYVAGLLGMMKSVNPDLSTKEAYKLLYDSGKETQATAETGRFIQADKVFLKQESASGKSCSQLKKSAKSCCQLK